MHTSENVMQVSAQQIRPLSFRRRSDAGSPCGVIIGAARRSSSGLEPQGNSQEQVSVNSGDTLWNIAQRYHVNVDHLRTFNQLTNNKILIGQTFGYRIVGLCRGPATTRAHRRRKPYLLVFGPTSMHA